jgi:hypothetical protein
MERKITKQDWKWVIRDMEFYNLKSAYVDFVNEELKTFVADPKIDGVGAFNCTLIQAKFFYENYNKPFVYLSSVGSAFNYETLMVYPVMSDGTIELNSGTHIDECDEEWYQKLDEDDTKLINEESI